MGDKTDAPPMANPPIKRKVTNIARDVEKAVPIAEIRNNRASIFNMNLLPYISPGLPIDIEPIIQPTNAELTAHPSIASDSWKYFVMKGTVPEITAVSNPNKSPPKAPVKLLPNMNHLFGLFVVARISISDYI